MSRVKLGDVAFERKETTKEETQLPIVGLEHITPGQLSLEKWSDNPDNTFTKLFHAGDILFGRRRAYLKKAAVAPFDGICSGDITVIAAHEERILPRLLACIIQNDAFFDYAVEHSAGSLSPRAKWVDLKNYEFNLPDSLEEQRKLADLLWSMIETKESYKALMTATDELVKSQFIEMFGDPATNPKGWQKATFEEISDLITDGEHATPKRCDEGIYLLSARNVLNHELSFEEVDYIGQDEYDRISKRLVPQAGDVLISCSGTVGRACSVPEGLKFQLVRSVALVRFKSEINPVFMEHQITMPYIQGQIDASKSQTSQANLFQGKIKKLLAIVPPLELQDKFLQFVEQTDKSKFALQEAIASLDKTYKKIIAETIQ